MDLQRRSRKLIALATVTTRPRSLGNVIFVPSLPEVYHVHSNGSSVLPIGYYDNQSVLLRSTTHFSTLQELVVAMLEVLRDKES